MAVGDIYRVTVEGLMHGQIVLNQIWYREMATDPAAPGKEVGLVQRFNAIIAPQFKAILSAEWFLVRVIAQQVHPLPPRVPYISTAAAGGGQVLGGALPTSVAGIIKKRTQFAGPKFRGRMFLAGVPLTSEDDSRLSAAAETAWQNAANAMNVTLTLLGDTWKMVLWRPEEGTFDEVTSLVVEPILRNQRRRQLGKGK